MHKSKAPCSRANAASPVLSDDASRREQDRFAVAMLYDCGSGWELAARGFTEDVTLAAQWNHSQTVPVLRSDLAYEAFR
ncbi:hypothetical protein [Brevibacillus parabrevis]|jgi:hypothetical protein|uniref:hypothetical protein n=1 Tax=Brevibacillus parabrevis TaxID=54914 RepID=UPI002490405E|nr:hypothetical protein [Brevibacillus parabrevis]